MITVFRNPEYRFAIPGPAVSFRSPKANAYKLYIRKVAKNIIKKPIIGPVEVRIDYFHYSPRKMDMDNISKCVMDALNGIAYKDDKQAQLQSSQAYNVSTRVILTEGPVDIIKPLQEYAEYLFIRVRDLAH